MFARFYALVAGLITLLGTFRVIMGFQLAGESPEAITRYLGTTTTGEAIDKGIYTLLIGLTMLLLANMVIHLEKLVKNKD